MVSDARHDNEQDYPGLVQDSVSLRPYHAGGLVELDADGAFTVVSVRDLRRFENMDAVALGVVASVDSTDNYVTVTGASFLAWGIEPGDEVVNTGTTGNPTDRILRVTADQLYVEDASIWSAADTFQVNKRVSHQGGQASTIRALSLVADQACYLRFDGAASADYFDARINANEGYFTDNIRVAARITAARLGAATVNVRFTVWGV